MEFSVENGTLMHSGELLYCHCCGAVLTEGDTESGRLFMDSHGNIYCRSCSEEVFECIDCHNTYHENEMEYIHPEGYVCHGCLSDNWTRCDDCDEYYRNGDLNEIETTNSWRSVCSNCLDDYYQCENCGHYVHCNDVCFDDDDVPYCEDCYRGEENSMIHNYHYSDDPAYNMEYLGEETRQNVLLMGVELEVENRFGDSWRKVQVAAGEVHDVIGEDYTTLCTDGSLVNGFEIISCPANLNHHKKTLHWKEGLEKLVELGYRSHDGGHCGLHVHIDRKYFETQDMEEVEAKFFISFRNNLEWLKAFSRRRNYEYCRPNGYGDDEVENISKFSAPPDKAWLKRKKDSRRYVAVNFNPDDTIEIRIFRGTLKYETFIATLELVRMWAFFVKTMPMDEICKLNLNSFKVLARDIGGTNFLNYVRDKVETNYQTATADNED